MWPVIYSDELLIINEENDIAIATGWIEKEYVKENINDLSRINLIGNTYSKTLCLNPILVNLSMNRYIRYIIFLDDDDKEKSYITLDKFFNSDLIEKDNEEYEEEFHNAINIVKRQIKLIKSNLQYINMVINNLPKLSKYNEDPIDIKKILIPKSSLIWDSYESSYICRSDDLKELYFEILNIIMKKGKESFRSESKLREINNLIYIYNGDDKSYEDLIDYNRLNDYYKEFDEREKELSKGISYTYPNRILHDKIIEILNKDKFTKRSYSPIFYPKDYELKDQPCCIGIHFLYFNDKLQLNIFFRSNDMCRAALYNLLAFRYYQRKVCELLGYEIGSTTIHASSAHIYSENWNGALEYIKKFGQIKNRFKDEEGYFITEKNNKNILVSFFSNCGKIQDMIEFNEKDYLENSYKVSKWINDQYHITFIVHEIFCLAHNIPCDSKNTNLKLEKKEKQVCTKDSCS